MHDTRRRRLVRTSELDEDVLHHFENILSTSTRVVANQLGIIQCPVWNVLREKVGKMSESI